MKILDQVKNLRGTTASSSLQRSDRAEVKAFHAGVVGSDAPKNRTSQVLLALAFGVTFVGAWLGLVGNELGFALLFVGLPATVAIGVWCFRNWDY